MKRVKKNNQKLKEVEKIIGNYRHMDAEINSLRMEKNRLRSNYELDAMIYSDMPKGQGKSSSPTEQKALGLGEKILALEEEIENLEYIKIKLDNLFNSRVLSVKEKDIIEKKLMDRLTWSEVEQQYQYCEKQLSRIKNSGIEKAYKLLRDII